MNDSEQARRARRATAGPTLPLAGTLNVGNKARGEELPARDVDALHARIEVLDDRIDCLLADFAALKERLAVLEGGQRT